MEKNVLEEQVNDIIHCFICFLKVYKPYMCPKCHKLYCLDCLKQWIATKSLVKIESNDNCTIYKVKYVECELCKT